MKQLLIIGGTGFENYLKGEDKEIKTPYGAINAKIGEHKGKDYMFISRHHSTVGKRPIRNPSRVPYRAHIFAGKSWGADYLFATTACGSLRYDSEPEVVPGDVVLVNQGADLTNRKPENSFSNDDLMLMHVAMSDPSCTSLTEKLFQNANYDFRTNFGSHLHVGGYVCIEGPQFSTRMESAKYRREFPEAKVIGMTMMTEAKLAREVGMHGVWAATVSDKDNAEQEEVTHHDVCKVMATFQNKAGFLLDRFVEVMDGPLECKCEEIPKQAMAHYNKDQASKEFDDLFGKFIE